MDKKLVRKAKKKDEESIRKIIELTKQRAYFIANASLRDSETAKDIVQEAYVTAFSKLSTLENEEKFESWFTTILNRQIINYIHSHHHSNEKVSTDFTSLETDEDFSFEENLRNTYEEWQPEAHVNYQELKEGVRGLLEELPEKQRLALIQYYFNEEKISDIAQEQNVSVNTVKGWLNYGRNKIKGRIEELRKNNASFYGVVPIPFLMHYLQELAQNTPDITVQVDTIVKSVGGVSAGAVAGHSFFEGIKGKIVAHKVASAVTASCVAVGGTVAVVTLNDKGAEYTVCSAEQYPSVHYDFVGTFPYEQSRQNSGWINQLDWYTSGYEVLFAYDIKQGQHFINQVIQDYNQKYPFYDEETGELYTNALKVSAYNTQLYAGGNDKWRATMDFGCYPNGGGTEVIYPLDMQTGKLYIDLEEYMNPGSRFDNWYGPLYEINSGSILTKENKSLIYSTDQNAQNHLVVLHEPLYTGPSEGAENSPDLYRIHL